MRYRIGLGQPFVLGAILVAIAFPFAFPALEIDDSSSYLIPARNWAEGRGLLDVNGAPLHDRLPLYPLVLGLTIRLFGDAPETLGLLNVALHVAAILVVRGALPKGSLRDFVSALAIVYPPLLTSTGFVLQESLLAFTLAVVFVTMRRALAEADVRASLVAGMSIGLSALAKTPVISVVLVLAAVLGARPGGRRGGLAALLGCLLVLLPWMVRNRIVLGSVDVVNANASLGVFGGTVSNNIEPNWYAFPEYLAARSRWNALDPNHRPSFDRFLTRLALDRIAADPGRWILLASERAIRFALPARHWFFATGHSKPASLGPVYAVAIAGQALLFGVAAWLAFAVGSGRRPVQDLAVPILVFAHQLVYALSYASPRYGASVGPVLFGGLALALAAPERPVLTPGR